MNVWYNTMLCYDLKEHDSMYGKVDCSNECLTSL